MAGGVARRGAAYGTDGDALLLRGPAAGCSGCAFVVVGVGARVTAVATAVRRRSPPAAAAASWPADLADWAGALADGVLAALVPLALLRPGGAAHRRWRVDGWRSPRRRSRPSSSPRRSTSGCSAGVAGWIVAVVGDGRRDRASRLRWWRQRAVDGDPLPAWLLAGRSPPGWPSCRARRLGEWLAVAARRRPPPAARGDGAAAGRRRRHRRAARHAVAVPRRQPQRVVEWAMLAGGIVVVYTGARRRPRPAASVAAVRRGSSSPRPVPSPSPSNRPAGTSAGSSTASSTARATIRSPSCSAIVDQLGADAGDDLLPALVVSLQQRAAPRRRRHRPPCRRRLATSGGDRTRRPPTTARLAPPPRRGRRPARRRLGATARRCASGTSEILDQLVGPLSLAVGWVRAGRRPAPIERGDRVGARGGAAAAAARPPRRRSGRR